MSVAVDRYLGYTVDLDVSKISEEQLDNIFDSDENWLGYESEFEQDKIYYVYDGMNGTFARAVVLITYQADVSWVDEDDEKLNKQLSKTPVPNEIKKRMESSISNLELSPIGDIKLRQWHLWV